MRRSILISAFIISSWTVSSCGNPYDSGIQPNSLGGGLPFGQIPSFSHSLNDYKRKVSEFDEDVDSDQYGRPTVLDPDAGIGDYTEESPFDFRTPANISLGDSTNFKQVYRNLKEIMDYGLVVGNLRMMVSVTSKTDDGQQSINTLILPENFRDTDLVGEAEIISAPTGYSYRADLEPEVFCSLAEVKQSDGRLDQVTPLLSYHQLEAGDREVGSPHCPIQSLGVDYDAEKPIQLQLKTEALPYHEGRRTIGALANFGFRKGSDYALIYELKFRTQNTRGETFHIIYTFYYIIIPVILTPPTELGAYRYLGNHGGHEYYLILANTPFTAVKQQAALLQSALGASKTYAIDINSEEEQRFIEGRIPFEHIWIGYDDIQNEGVFVPHSGAEFFPASRRAPRAARYQNWEDRNEPNDGNGGEDAVHINRKRLGAWNDLGIHNSLKVIMEAEFEVENKDFR